MTRVLRTALALASLVLAGPAGADDVPPDAVVAAIPFEALVEPNRILLNLAPDGSPPFKLMLDTGASYSVLTPSVARRLGVAVSRTKQDPYRRATRLGTDLQFYVNTTRSDTGARTFEYGLLGGNLLSEYVVDFDFGGRQIRFLDPRKYAVPESTTEPEAAVVPLRVTAHRATAEIRVNGRPLRVLIDTGWPTTAQLSGADARDLGIDPDALPDFGQGQDVLGPMKLRLLESAEVEIGGLRFSSMPIEVAPRGWTGFGGEADTSVLGYDLLSRFRARIDYPRSRMWLKRERSAATFYGVDYAATRAAGALLYPTGGGRYRVFRVFADSPADHLGLRKGDIVTPQTADGGVRTEVQLIEAIRSGGSVRVARKVNDIFTDVDLPEDATLEGRAK